MTQEKKLFPCFVCKNNGFPDEMIILAGRDESGASIRKNPNETPHTHKTKLAKRPYATTQTIPMSQYKPPQTTNNNMKTKDEQIAEYHQENRQDREAYREMLKKDVEAKFAIAEALRELAHAIKIKSTEPGGGGGTLD